MPTHVHGLFRLYHTNVHKEQSFQITENNLMFKSKVDSTHFLPITAQKTKFSIKDFFSKCDQIQFPERNWSHLLKKPLIKNFIFMQCIFPFYFNTKLCSIAIAMLTMLAMLTVLKSEPILTIFLKTYFTKTISWCPFKTTFVTVKFAI